MKDRDSGVLSLGPAAAAPTLVALAAAKQARVAEDSRLHVKDRGLSKLPGWLTHCEQTFILREEALAQDVAAAPELHPDPAVGGSEGLWDLVATKPTWEVEKNGQASGHSKRGLNAGSGVSSNVVHREQ